jgi:hypothetical protein
MTRGDEQDCSGKARAKGVTWRAGVCGVVRAHTVSADVAAQRASAHPRRVSPRSVPLRASRTARHACCGVRAALVAASLAVLRVRAHKRALGGVSRRRAYASTAEEVRWAARELRACAAR